jgi:hypothetical protein
MNGNGSGGRRLWQANLIVYGARFLGSRLCTPVRRIGVVLVATEECIIR